VLGLFDAFGKFDSSKHVLFQTYARFRVRVAILDSLRTLDWSPRELKRKGRLIEVGARISASMARGLFRVFAIEHYPVNPQISMISIKRRSPAKYAYRGESVCL